MSDFIKMCIIICVGVLIFGIIGSIIAYIFEGIGNFISENRHPLALLSFATSFVIGANQNKKSKSNKTLSNSTKTILSVVTIIVAFVFLLVLEKEEKNKDAFSIFWFYFTIILFFVARKIWEKPQNKHT